MSRKQRRFKLDGSQDQFDHKKQTVYCINYTKQHVQNQKKQSFMNKLTFDYSLQKINREKFIGNLIPLSSRMYPAIKSQGNKFCNFQYSSDLFKQTRSKFMSQRYERGSQQLDETKDQLRKYKYMIAKKKSIQGGIDSFWIFKKDRNREDKKKNKGNAGGDGSNEENNSGNQQNKMQQAYFKLLTFSKLPLELDNSLVPKNSFKNYISSVFGQTFSLWFISFYQIKSYINFKQFETICQKFENISLRQCHLVSFFLYDDNGDGFICPRDLFAVFEKQITLKIDKDILKIAQFIKQNIGIKNTNNQTFKIQNVCIRDDWLTIKDYQMYFKKVDEPYLKATNKKDTVFSKSFAILDHREKVRSKRKQMNQKKNLYEQLYGQISKMKKNEAYIDSDSDYKLNYTLLHKIFGLNSTELYKHFMHFLLGIEVKQFIN